MASVDFKPLAALPIADMHIGICQQFADTVLSVNDVMWEVICCTIIGL